MSDIKQTPSYMSSVDYWKGNFITNLINEMNYTSYLELGIGAGSTWKNVKCNKKVGVDICISGENIVNCTTDDFFKENTNTFDIIYIDADHHREQVYRDYASSFRCLNNNGILLFHDVNPPNEDSTVFTGAGDVYKLWINMCKLHTELYTISARNNKEEDTLGVIIKNRHKFNDFSMLDYSWKDYDKQTYVYSNELTVYGVIDLLKKYKFEKV